MPMGPQARIRDAIADNVTITATCPAAHAYRIDLRALTDLAGPYAHLDEVLATRSWCPACGALAAHVTLSWPEPPRPS